MTTDAELARRTWFHCGTIPADGTRHICVYSDTIEHSIIASGLPSNAVYSLTAEHNAAVDRALAQEAESSKHYHDAQEHYDARVASEARCAKLVKALNEIYQFHVPDQPMASDISETVHILRQVAYLRRIAAIALDELDATKEKP